MAARALFFFAKKGRGPLI